MNLNLNNVIDQIDIPSIFTFAEKEVIIASGPRADMGFDLSISPIATHLWPILFSNDLTRYDEIVITGPSQCGKTLSLIIPMIYLLTIMGESVIFAAPNYQILADKWQTEVYPLIASSPNLRSYLLDRKNDVAPKLSTTNSYLFRNGTNIRLISTQSADRAKSSYTARNLVITEFGGVKSQSTSEETDPLRQLKARCRSFSNVGYRFVLESTGTTVGGIVEQHYQKGTRSEICGQCPHCHNWVSPWRKDFHFNIDNPEQSYFECPSCQGIIDEPLRQTMIRNTQLITTVPESNIFSMRLSGFFNHFSSIRNFAKEELELSTLVTGSSQHESKLKEIQNFVYGEPYTPPLDNIDLSLFDIGPDKLSSKDYHRGDVPEWKENIVLGIDVQLRYQFWTLTAWGHDPNDENKLIGHIIDYGIDHTRYEEEQHLRAKDTIVIESLNNLIQNLKGHYEIDLILADIGYLFSSLIFWTNSHEKDYRILGAHGIGIKSWRTRSEKLPTTNEIKVIRPFEDGAVCYRIVDQMKYVRHASPSERFFLTEMLRTNELTLFSISDPTGHEDYIKSLDSHFQIVSEEGEIVWEKRKGSTDHHLDSAILTLTGYKILHPQYQFANKERYQAGKEKKHNETILIEKPPIPPTVVRRQPNMMPQLRRRGGVIKRR